MIEEKKKIVFIPNEAVIPLNHQKVYDEALEFSGLHVPDQIYTRNVKIYNHDHIHEITTNNSPDLPHLVLLHGFGGTALTYIRTFSSLFEHFQVHALDIFGIGYSSRGNYKESFTEEEVKNYYIDAI